MQIRRSEKCVWQNRTAEREEKQMDQKKIGNFIAKLRKEKGMTQKQLASEIGVSPSRVNDYISGRSEPTLKIARLLCRVLNIHPAAMLGF